MKRDNDEQSSIDQTESSNELNAQVMLKTDSHLPSNFILLRTIKMTRTIALFMLLCFLIGYEVSDLPSRKRYDELMESTSNLLEENLQMHINESEWNLRKFDVEKKLSKYKQLAKKYAPITELRKEEIVSLYHLYNGNYKKIGEIVGLDGSTIRKALLRWGCVKSLK